MSLNDTLAVTLLAASDHPDAEFRGHLTEQVEGWVASLQPRYSAAEVSELLGRCKGTVLEPFTLNDDETDIAVLLARIGFSRAVDQTRFRVVSNQTLGSRGGCVLTNNLKYFYAERFALAKRRRIGVDYWHYVPRNKPTISGYQRGSGSIRPTELMSFASATAKLNTDGYRVNVSVPSLAALKWQDSWRLSAMLGNHSRLGNSGDSLSDLNINVSLASNEVQLSPASPEAMMRLTAQLMSNRLLVLSPGLGHEGAASIHVRLSLPREGEDATLNTLVSLGSGYFADWIRADMNEAPALSKEDRLKITEWTMPPEDWVDEELLETI